jgi:hypothetical protein
MLVKKPVKVEADEPLSRLQRMALQYLPPEQVKKFSGFEELLEKELENEAREPEIENALKDIFDALHDRNAPKLLKVLQGDKTRFFHAFKRQLEAKQNLTRREASILLAMSEGEISLLTLSLM